MHRERERWRGGVEGCVPMATVFLLALVSQTSSESQSGGNTHTHTVTFIRSHSLREKPNKDSYMHREGD